MSLWAKLYARKRAAIDRALLASMEREIANEERLRAKQAAADMKETPEERRVRIARAFGRPL